MFWNLFLDETLMIWGELKSELSVTYQQDFSKETAGSLKSNTAFGKA